MLNAGFLVNKIPGYSQEIILQFNIKLIFPLVLRECQAKGGTVNTVQFNQHLQFILSVYSAASSTVYSQINSCRKKKNKNTHHVTMWESANLFHSYCFCNKSVCVGVHTVLQVLILLSSTNYLTGIFR